MRIKIRQHNASTPQEDGWAQTGDWLGELRDDNHAMPPGDGHAEPDGTEDPWPGILAQADAFAQADARAQADAFAQADARAQADAFAQADARAQADGPAEADVPGEVPVEAAAMPAEAMTTFLETEPERPAITPRPAPARSLAAMQRNRPRPLEVAQCSMCGIALPLALLVPDGGQACADIRWYCKDALSCTERWTTARPPGQAPLPAAPDDAFAGAGEAVPVRTSTERLGSVFEVARSAG